MNNKTIYRAVLAFALLASVIFGVFMTLSIAQSTNSTITDINAYSADKVKFFNLISWLYTACLIGILCFTFAYKAKFTKSIKFSSRSFKNICILGGCTTAGLVLYSVVAEIMLPPVFSYTDRPNSIDAFYRIIKHTLVGNSVNWSYLALIIVIAFSSLYFFYCVFSKQNKYSNLFAGLSMLPAVALAAKLIFDFLMQNSNGFGQLYNYHLLTLGFFLLFFVNESRFYMRKAAPALYVFFGISGAISAAVFAIPILSLSLSGIAQANSANIIFCFADLAIVAYIYARLISLEIKIPKATKQGVCIDESTENTENIE